MNVWYVYILKGNNKKFYKGLTNDLEKRIKQHIQGQCNTTKNMKGFVLIHVEICYSRKEARKIEKFFKSGYGREVIKELLVSQLPEC